MCFDCVCVREDLETKDSVTFSDPHKSLSFEQPALSSSKEVDETKNSSTKRMIQMKLATTNLPPTLWLNMPKISSDETTGNMTKAQFLDELNFVSFKQEQRKSIFPTYQLMNKEN